MAKKPKTRAERERERGKLKSWKLKGNKLNRAARQVTDEMLRTHTAGERKLKEEKKFLLEVYRDYSTVLDSFNLGENDRGSIENQIREVYPQERITKNANAGVKIQPSLNKLTEKKREMYDKSRRLLESMKKLAEKEVNINALLGLRTGYSDEQQYAAEVRDRSRELLEAFDEFDDKDKAVLNEVDGFREMYSFAVNMQRHYALNMGGALNKDDYKSAVHLERINVNPKTDIIDSIVNVRSRVIFSHEPSPTDIHQGSIGNCYMLSVLAGLAANNPEKIKEMITDNEDGTATVRFFDKKNKPVLVTVDKSVPRFGGLDSGSADCLWAQLIEKAYAVSGIHTNGGYPETDETKSVTFDRISGGDPVSMMQTLLGPEVKESITYTPGSFGNNNEAMKDFIKKSLDTGKVITLCTLEDPNRPGRFPNNEAANGFSAGHAYSAVSYNDKYLFVRDPWGKDGIVHKDDFTPEKEGSFIKREKTLPEGIHAIPWEAMPKINRYFHGFDVHEIKNKRREVNLTDAKKDFKTVVDDLAGKLNKTDSFIKRYFYNSKEFNKFATALNDLNNSLDKKSISMDELKEKFLEVKKTAEAYENRTAPKNRGKNFNLRKNIAATAKQFNAMFRDYGKEMSVEESMRKVYVDNVAGKFAEYMRGHDKPNATKAEILNSPSFKKFVNNSSLAELSDGALKMTSDNINTMIEHKLEEAQIVRVNQAMEI